MNKTLLAFAVGIALCATDTALADDPATMPNPASGANVAGSAADAASSPPTLKSVEVSALSCRLPTLATSRRKP